MAENNKFLITYLFWLIGGIFGLHHFYLKRDKHAFLWFATFGGLGLGWLRDLFCIPRYISETQDGEQDVEKSDRPVSSVTRTLGMILTSFLWCILVIFAVSDSDHNVYWKVMIMPLACALGVWTVGTIGRHDGCFLHALIAAYLAFPLYLFLENSFNAVTVMCLFSALTFEEMCKRYKCCYKEKRLIARVSILVTCAFLYLSIFGISLYNTAAIGYGNREVLVRDVTDYVIKYPNQTWKNCFKTGCLNTFREIADLQSRETFCKGLEYSMRKKSSPAEYDEFVNDSQDYQIIRWWVALVHGLFKGETACHPERNILYLTLKEHAGIIYETYTDKIQLTIWWDNCLLHTVKHCDVTTTNNYTFKLT